MSQTLFSSWNDNIRDARQNPEQSITAEDIGLSMSYDQHEVQAIVSWNGLIIADDKISIVALINAYIQEILKLACGECNVGYHGTRIVAEILQKLVSGNGKPEDIDILQKVTSVIKTNVKCDFCAQAIKPVIDSLNYYKNDFINAATKHDPLPEVDYITKITAPCMEACPVHQDIPNYIELVRNHRYSEALQVIQKTNCFPGITGRTCVAFCEKNCVRNDIDKPLAIRALKRVPADIGIIKTNATVKHTKKDRVAVIGAGPAGLTAARHLALQGYRVTVYDEQQSAGGMVMSGIPAYRLPRKTISSETSAIQGMGVEFRLGTRVRYLDDLTYTYKAVLVASGAHLSKNPEIDNWGKDYSGLMEGIKFLHEINSGSQVTPGEKVVIVGGGNTAIDCARTAVRLGSQDVTVVYRRSRKEMPARIDEIEAAEKEGVKFLFLVLPTRIITENNNVIGAECLRMELGEPDASGRRKPVKIEGSEFTISANLILTAIGESPDISFLPQGKIELTSWNSIKVDKTGRTNIPWLFAAGDCVTGPASIVEAMAGGKRTAEAIDSYLSKNKNTDTEQDSIDQLLHDTALSHKRYGAKPPVKERQQPHELFLEDRINNFNEVEQCFNMQAASQEAERCLRCYRVLLMVRK